ncbi:MAG: hypothetical protein IT379_03335, partial [Deltaproteobacteria bacterium]|nr:hypothetical protein [Deltaproteobacteria bacterium]
VVAASCGCATPAGEPPDRGREPEPVVGTDGAGESPISYGAPAPEPAAASRAPPVSATPAAPAGGVVGPTHTGGATERAEPGLDASGGAAVGPRARGVRTETQRVIELVPLEVPGPPARADGMPTDTRGLGSASDVVLRVRYEGSGPADTWHAWLVRGERELHLFGGIGSLFEVARVVALEDEPGAARRYVATVWFPETLRFYAAVVDATTFALVGEPICVEPRFTVDFPRGDWVVRTYPLLVLGESRRPMVALVEPNGPARLYPRLGRRARVLPFRAPDAFARFGPGDEPRPDDEHPFVPVARLRGRLDARDAYLEPVAVVIATQ